MFVFKLNLIEKIFENWLTFIIWIREELNNSLQLSTTLNPTLNGLWIQFLKELFLSIVQD